MEELGQSKNRKRSLVTRRNSTSVLPSTICYRDVVLAAAFIANVGLTAHAQTNPPASTASTQQVTSAFTTLPERCIVPASTFHGVNPWLLRAVLQVESGLKPDAIGKNSNGTIDIGIGQMNSMHLPELKKYGIEAAHLTDACVATYVAAWHLKKLVTQYGNTWEAVARYHSATPVLNQRYQILLRNQLIKSAVLPGVPAPVPPINQNASPTTRQSEDSQNAARFSSMSVFEAPQ
ncbi:transglycosylase SLT domain protein [Ostertagia ostertagi]